MAAAYGVGETGEAAALMETISLFSWLDEDWTMGSETSSSFYETSPVNTVERNTTETQSSRGNRICAFFKRARKAIKKPFFCCRQIRVEPQTPQENPHTADPEPVPGPSGLQNTSDAGLSSVPGVSNYESNNGEFEPKHDLEPVNTESVSVPVGEAEQVATWMETISFCCDFCPWLSEHWTKVSEASTPLHETSPDNTVERNTSETQSSRGNRIRAFFKRAWKTIKKPFLCCRQIRVEPQTPQENPHTADPEPEPVPGPSGLQNTTDAGLSSVPGVSNYESNNGEFEPKHDLEPVNTESVLVHVGEAEQVATWMETISFCCDFCPWLSEHWTKVSEASTPLHETSPDNTVERNTSETQSSRGNRIRAFFKRARKAIKKPFLCCRQIRVEPQTPQENPHLVDSEPEPDPDPESIPGASNCEPNNESLTNLYRLENELGFGAFGEVFMAVRNSDGKEVAIKRIPKRGYERYIMIPGCSRSLFKEVALMLLLRRPPVSPYVIEMFEWFDQPDNISLVMEYPQPCLSLLEYISRNGLLSEEIARCLMRQLVLALQNCLDHGIMHNDVHYNNILVNTRTLELKLIDFGCAFQVSRDEHESIVPGLLLDLGLLLYFMFIGDPDEEVESCTSLIPSLSPECCNLMDTYLKPDSEWKTLDQILHHQWFKH